MLENIEFRHIVCDYYIKSPFKCSVSSACDVTACDNEMKATGKVRDEKLRITYLYILEIWNLEFVYHKGLTETRTNTHHYLTLSWCRLRQHPVPSRRTPTAT